MYVSMCHKMSNIYESNTKIQHNSEQIKYIYVQLIKYHNENLLVVLKFNQIKSNKYTQMNMKQNEME